MKNRNNVLTKLFLVFLLTALTIFILIFFVVRNYLNAQNIEIFKQDLNQKSQTILSSIIPLVSSQNIPALKQNIDKLSSSLGNRITLINPQGLVIADSQNDEKNMSDHFNRPEVKSVLEGANFGQDIRKSATDSQATLYYAIPIKTDEKLLGVLRLSIPINNVKAFENNTLRNILFTSVIIIFICIVAVYFIWRKFTKDISTLMDTISEISKGNFQVKAQIKSDSQVFQFAKALNKMSQDLEQLFLQTKEFDNLKKDFISNASHELKTPITAIVGFSQMLQTQELNDETKHYVEIIQKQSKRLSNIVTDILSLSDLENTDAKEIEKTDVEIS
ncbi:MAG: hypothetical protein LBC07_05240, partial [Elusimicrobiota bacterium]|nr:hypothetical protein [Elusimicrobiota bacterium]